jgi:ribonuclease Z
MKYHQKDIVEIDFPIPGEGYKVHPALIVSNDELQLDEGFVYVALISSQDSTLETRKKRYMAEADTAFSGHVFVPDDLERIVLCI